MQHQAFERISKALEGKGTIDIDGKPYAIWLVDLRSPRSPGGLHSLVVIGARHGAESHTGELHVGHERLADTEFIVDNAVETMRQIVRGELPPGTNALL
jgi:hypothetical protein